MFTFWRLICADHLWLSYNICLKYFLKISKSLTFNKYLWQDLKIQYPDIQIINSIKLVIQATEGTIITGPIKTVNYSTPNKAMESPRAISGRVVDCEQVIYVLLSPRATHTAPWTSSSQWIIKHSISRDYRGRPWKWRALGEGPKFANFYRMTYWVESSVFGTLGLK